MMNQHATRPLLHLLSSTLAAVLVAGAIAASGCAEGVVSSGDDTGPQGGAGGKGGGGGGQAGSGGGGGSGGAAGAGGRGGAGGGGAGGAGGSGGGSGGKGGSGGSGGSGGAGGGASAPSTSPPPGAGLGGSGLGGGAPNLCVDPGSSFSQTSYSDRDSFCDFVQLHFAVYQRMLACPTFTGPGVGLLPIDTGLNATAQAEAEAVAKGAAPAGDLMCVVEPCGPKNPAFWDNEGGEFMYVAGDGTADVTFTAPETDYVITSGPGGSDDLKACQFLSMNTSGRLNVYYHCWDPTTRPTKLGCGVAVDTNGVTWRVVKTER